MSSCLHQHLEAWPEKELNAVQVKIKAFGLIFQILLLEILNKTESADIMTG